jgi:hypothetical protein
MNLRYCGGERVLLLKGEWAVVRDSVERHCEKDFSELQF